MSTILHKSTGESTRFGWLASFFHGELEAYPGRGLIVARMVIAATITMLVVMTLKIPGGALGTLYAFLVPRDNIQATLHSAGTTVVSYAAGLAFVLMGAILFADQPLPSFIWFCSSMLVLFFAMQAIKDIGIATGFSVLVINTLPLWQTGGSAEYRVEHTLWIALGVAIGTTVTVCTELTFRSLGKSDDFVEAVSSRLQAVEALFDSRLQSVNISSQILQDLSYFALVGVGDLRRSLERGPSPERERESRREYVELLGRLVDLSYVTADSPAILSGIAPAECSGVIQRLRVLRDAISTAQTPHFDFLENWQSFSDPILHEIQQIIDAIPSTYDVGRGAGLALSKRPRTNFTLGVLKEDAFTNPQYVAFAIRGCLAVSLCYLTYNLLAWPALASSVTTCVFTALSTTGAAKQKQLLRISGTLVGGILLGLGSQVFLLPHIDSILGFCVLFVVVSAVAAYITTSGPRLSYLGVQVALAFYLINLQEFHFQTSLVVARDRVIGVILGLTAMWLVYEHLGTKRAMYEMVDAFIDNLKSIALALDGSFEQAGEIDNLRARVSANFNTVTLQADAVPFDLGYRWDDGMLVRSSVIRWQPLVRRLYVFEIAMWENLRTREANAPDSYKAAARQFGVSSATLLRQLADHLQGKQSEGLVDIQQSLEDMEDGFRRADLAENWKTLADQRIEISVRVADELRDLAREIQEWAMV